MSEERGFVEFLTTGRARMREPMAGQPISNQNQLLRFIRCFTGPWTPWMPIGVFLIHHADGPILVDTGASSECMKPGYVPSYMFVASILTQLEVEPKDDIVEQLKTQGISPRDLQAIVVTHLHTDHAGGLEDIVKLASDVPVYMSADHWEAYGKHPTWADMQGCASKHWPKDLNLKLLKFEGSPVGPWTGSEAITPDGQVVAVPTPGHVPGHISVIITEDAQSGQSPSTFLAVGDATYNVGLLEREEPDGINQDPKTAFESLRLIKEFSRQKDVVVLPSHDPDTPRFLRERVVYKPGK
ncbi:hypothetical protein V2G26_019026 [Clonostachys chloroleuca]|uniref:Metallo-beta-lactamase domain-containing protein n=1 Tax=Clonostachys chloroleuca TaxID=1926264 RepID=A0AA35PY29_9HYPO|nr:unnamed protein product [Clonostachys chloroleuca]